MQSGECLPEAPPLRSAGLLSKKSRDSYRCPHHPPEPGLSPCIRLTHPVASLPRLLSQGVWDPVPLGPLSLKLTLRLPAPGFCSPGKRFGNQEGPSLRVSDCDPSQLALPPSSTPEEPPPILNPPVTNLVSSGPCTHTSGGPQVTGLFCLLLLSP